MVPPTRITKSEQKACTPRTDDDLDHIDYREHIYHIDIFSQPRAPRFDPLVAGTVSCRDFFGGVLSDLRSPRRVGRSAGVDLVGTCAGDGKVEISDMLCPPGKNTPSMFRGDHVCSDVMLYMCQKTWETSVRPFLFFWTRRIACNSQQLRRGLGAWATTAGNTNGDVEAWHMAPKILLGICMGASSTSLFTTTAVPCSKRLPIDN